MNGIALAPAHDSGGAHPHDSTGAFQPGARAFCKVHGLPPPHLFDNRPPLTQRLGPVLGAITAVPDPISCIAIFSHGWRTGAQWGASIPAVPGIALRLAPHLAEGATIILYACSTGEALDERDGHSPDATDVPGAGEGSLADALRDAIAKGCTVYAHASVGHAYRNPYVRRFSADLEPGGEYVVAPDSERWKAWVHALGHSDLWARFPFMSRAQIAAELGSTSP